MGLHIKDENDKISVTGTATLPEGMTVEEANRLIAEATPPPEQKD